MSKHKNPFSKSWLILGGMVFGLYYTLGLAYFETFVLLVKNVWAFYLPVWLVLSAASIGLALRLLPGRKPAPKQANLILEWVMVPTLTFGAAAMLLYVYGLLAANAFSPGQLFVNMALIGLLPLQIALILIPQPRTVSPNRPANASGVHQELPETSIATAEKMLLIEASQGEPQFKVRLADLIAVEAADNYCKFHYLKDGQLKMKLLRMTMKEAEEAVQEMAAFHRCHRSFLVNGQMVKEVIGNSQAYRLKMMFLEEPIPVSRSYDIETLKRNLSH